MGRAERADVNGIGPLPPEVGGGPVPEDRRLGREVQRGGDGRDHSLGSGISARCRWPTHGASQRPVAHGGQCMDLKSKRDPGILPTRGDPHAQSH